MAYISNADDILNADDFTYEDIEVEEWGGTIRLKSLSGTQRTVITALATKHKDGDGLFEKLIIMSVVNERGEPVFKNENLETLKNKNAAVTQRIGKKVLEISGFSEDAVPDIESAEKN